MVELRRVGSALVPTYASPSIDRFWNLTSIFGISIPTLNPQINHNQKTNPTPQSNNNTHTIMRFNTYQFCSWASGGTSRCHPPQLWECSPWAASCPATPDWPHPPRSGRSCHCWPPAAARPCGGGRTSGGARSPPTAAPPRRPPPAAACCSAWTRPAGPATRLVCSAAASYERNSSTELDRPPPAPPPLPLASDEIIVDIYWPCLSSEKKMWVCRFEKEMCRFWFAKRMKKCVCDLFCLLCRGKNWKSSSHAVSLPLSWWKLKWELDIFSLQRNVSEYIYVCVSVCVEFSWSKLGYNYTFLIEHSVMIRCFRSMWTAVK